MVLCSAQLAVERDSAYSTTLAVASGKPLVGLREVTELRDGSRQRMSNLSVGVFEVAPDEECRLGPLIARPERHVSGVHNVMRFCITAHVDR